MPKEKPTICLIDASGYIHRAYHALPMLTTTKGEPVNAIYGFSRMVSKLLKTEKPDYLAVCLDTAAPTFRHEMYKEYKETRSETESALIHQLPVAAELAEHWGLPCVKKDGFEADDVIATLAVQAAAKGWKVLILTGDKDILQLVNENIMVRDEIRKVDFDVEKVQSRFGVTPKQLVDYFSLIGDKVDNVIGVPGVGDKTAVKILAEHGSIDHFYSHMNGTNENLKKKLLEHKSTVMRNRELVTLRSDVPLPVSVDDLKIKQPDLESLVPLLQRLEFRAELYGVDPGSMTGAVHNTERQTHVVLTKNDLADLKKALSGIKTISYDLETDSLDHHSCGAVGLAISVKPGEGWYVPIAHSYIGMPKQLPWEEVKAVVKPVLEDPHVLKCGQNLKFDNSVLWRYDIHPTGKAFDTLIAAYCIDPSRNSYGLKILASEFLNERMVTFEELVGKEKGKTIADVSIEEAARYSAADAEVSLRLMDLFAPKLKAEGVEELFEKWEMPLVDVLGAMENAGVAVDLDYLQQVRVKFEAMRQKLEKEIQDIAGEPFLLNSPQQLSRILFEKLKLPTGKKTKTGYSTDESVLTKLALSHPICEKILSYREIAKLSSTYIDALFELVDQKSGRVHTSFQQTGTATGRLSSNSPNLQNIPIRSEQGREIRKAFVSAKGNVLVSADYSQIDLRALAHMSEDPILIRTFRAGGDIHQATAAEMFHVAPKDVTSEMRRRAKAINFGIVYGQQAWGLSQSLNIDVTEAQEFITQYFERYAGVKKWIEQTLAQARKDGFVTTLAGRKRRIDGINAENSSLRGFAERIAVNTPIQGTSADIIKAAMIAVHADLNQRKMKTLMLVQVHDELLFDVPKAELDSALQLIRAGMEGAYTLKVPLVVDIKVGANWNDMEKISQKANA